MEQQSGFLGVMPYNKAMFNYVRRAQNFSRYRRIITVFAQHGFGSLLEQWGVDRYLITPARLLRRQELERHTPAEHFRMALEELGPTFIKIGQILSTRPDLLPPDYIHELSKLQDAAPPIPWEDVEAQLAAEWGRPPEEVLGSIDKTPLAAASLAQVHAATLPDGREIIVKVQRPGIWPTIQSDLAILEDLASVAQRTSLGDLYNPVDIVNEFAFTLQGELNYLQEARNADRFRKNFAEEPALYIPEVHWDLTTRRVLVLERIYGIKIDNIEAMDRVGIDRKQVALNAARVIVKEVLEDGFFHADPHPGNFFVMPGGVIGAVDFGMVGHLTREDRINLIKLYVASVRLDADRIVEQLIRMGAATAYVDRQALKRSITRLLTKYQGLPLKEIRAKEVVSDIMPIAYRFHLRLPPDLWLLGKTLGMMEGVGLQLDPDFDMFAVSQPFADRLMREMWMPSTWGPEVFDEVQAWGDLLNVMPRASAKLLYGLESGKVPLDMSFDVQRPVLDRLDRALTRLAVSLLLGSFILALALLISLASASPIITGLIGLGFLAAMGLGLWFLISVLRRV
jgi:ubiquinone biosynthesis protein